MIVKGRLLITLLVLLSLTHTLYGSEQLFLANDPVYIGEQSFIERLENIDQPVGLVLSGGSARAFAHIGVLRYLEEKHIVPDFIVSNSMGSIVGILYAAGLSPDQIYEVISSFDSSSHFSLRFPFKGGLINSRLTGSLVHELLGDRDLRDLPIPVMIICEDLYTGRQIRIAEGTAHIIMQAAFALPFYFDPVSFRDYLLIDGGVSNLVPLEAAYRYTETVIASTTFYRNPDKNLLNPLTILNTAIDITKTRTAVDEIERFEPFLIRCDVEEFSFMAFDQLEELSSTGYESAVSAGDLPFSPRHEIRDLSAHRDAYEPIIRQVVTDYRAFHRIRDYRPVGSLSLGLDFSQSQTYRRQLQHRITAGPVASLQTVSADLGLLAGVHYKAETGLTPALAISANVFPHLRVQAAAAAVVSFTPEPDYYLAASLSYVPYVSLQGIRGLLHAGYEYAGDRTSLLTFEAALTGKKSAARAGYTLEDGTDHALYAETGFEVPVGTQIYAGLVTGGRVNPFSCAPVDIRPLDSLWTDIEDFGPWVLWHTADLNWHLEGFRPTFAELLMLRNLTAGGYVHTAWHGTRLYYQAGVQSSVGVSFIGLSDASITMHAGYQSEGSPFTGGVSLTL
jgi:NTE family protein